MGSFPLLVKAAAERALDEGWAISEPSRPALAAVAAPPGQLMPSVRSAVHDGWTVDDALHERTSPPLPAPPSARPLLPALVALPRPPVPAPLAPAPRQGSSPPGTHPSPAPMFALPLPPPAESYPGFSCDETEFFSAGDDITIAAVGAPHVAPAPSPLRRFRAAVRRIVATFWPIDP